MTLRKFKGLVLIVALFAGGVVAPVSHFVYMAACDADMSGMDHADHSDHATHPDEGSLLVTTDADGVACTYAALFATQMAGDTPPSDHFVAPTFVELEHTIRNQTRIGTTESTYSIRGPPSSPIAVS